MLQLDTNLFGDRYTLARAIERRSDFEMWEARDAFGGPVLVKVWPFGREKPADEERALWNAELRHLYRLASLPESDEHLVVLRDAGIEWTHRCFVMAMGTPGLSLLDSLLAKRGQYEWLKNVTNHAVRAELWRGARRLILGIIQLHQQQMFHRAISAKSVLVDPERGPSTLRLGGFEWTVRLGDERGDIPAIPESTGTYSFESDWFLLGRLLARLVAATNPEWDLPRVNAAIGQQQHLIGDERDLLHGLLTDNSNARLNQGHEIIQRVDAILATLDEPRRLSPEDYLALVVVMGPQRPLTLSIIEIDEDISALDLEGQRKFIEDDLDKPRLIRRQRGGADEYSLVGNRLSYLITEYVRDEGTGRGAWDLAFSGSPTDVRSSPGEEDQVELRKLPIRVFTTRALAKDDAVVRRSSVSWKPFLPKLARTTFQQDALQRLHDFFRVTNQIELLMHDAEIFSYEVQSTRTLDGAEEVTIREIARARAVPDFAKLVEGLAAFLNREDEARDGDLVYLGEEDALDMGREVPRTEFWKVVDADTDTGIVTVRRPKRPGQPTPPQRGFLRAFGLFGQMSLIKRRKRAIDRLGAHGYLLRALQYPAYTFLDSGSPLPLKIDPEKIDEAKSAAMRSIWRTRPIFALQGPPGTGKTTLVASLLGQIFQDDAVAQVLVTAQAHAAVDVLRDKVTAEIAELPAPPLAVRLQRTKGDVTPDPDYVEQVAWRILAHSVASLGEEPIRQPLQSRWLETAQEVMHALNRGDTEGHAKDLAELVKRAAGITYCTTTAGNLAELADSTQTFDWSIVEEAGKAHGFDLVLPLQTGHRWLLIGDQKQLAPYRYQDFYEALTQLDETFQAINELPRRAGGQVDIDLILRWAKYDDNDKALRREFWLRWLMFFSRLHAACSRAKLPAIDAAVEEEGGAVLAYMLSQQHRMHPTIAGLVSVAYYDGLIESKTIGADDTPLKRVLHTFTSPTELAGRAIVWIDIPSVTHEPEARGEDIATRYTSEVEVEAVVSFLRSLEAEPESRMELAVLSPYRRQVKLLNDRLRAGSLPDWVQPREGKGIGATVDSFQGNQADIVIVSLVRNNDKPVGTGLGFLREARRMNVLFSRAERLLVLVGSWQFFQDQLTGVPADANQPLGHWRLAMDYLQECMMSGTAVLIPARSLGGTR